MKIMLYSISLLFVVVIGTSIYTIFNAIFETSSPIVNTIFAIISAAIATIPTWSLLVVGNFMIESSLRKNR